MRATIIVIGQENTPSTRVRVHRYRDCFGALEWDVVVINAGELYRLSSIIRLFTSRWVMIQKSLISTLALRLLRLCGIRLFYDFDDAIYLKYPAKKRVKFENNLKLVDKVFAGNENLAEYARQFQPNVAIIPSPIEEYYVESTKRRHSEQRTVIGWIGTAPNLQYLELVVPALEVLLSEGHELVLRIVSSEPPDLNTAIPLDFRLWRLEEEVKSISEFDIGLMPLFAGEWEAGKCSFKLLSYMAQGVPSIASPVGMNNEVIINGVNGFLASDPKEWADAIRLLISDDERRMEVAESGLLTVQANYTRKIVFDKLLQEIQKTLSK